MYLDHSLRRRRSIFRRRRRRRLVAQRTAAVGALLAVAGLMALSVVREGASSPADRAAAPPIPLAGASVSSSPGDAAPPEAGGTAAAERLRERVDRAREVALAAPGEVSFALIGADGQVRGHHEHATYPSASIVKAMLLAAETRRLHAAGAPLDTTTEALLRSMITYSDNDAATAIYTRVGDGGLESVAERAGMSDFSVAISWGWAEVSAADMALFFSDLDAAFPREHRELAKGLLGSIVTEQSWGLPVAARGEWSVRFKGGWRKTETGQLVHQAGELRRDGRELAIAVLSDGQPSMEAGIDVVEGVAGKLLGS